MTAILVVNAGPSRARRPEIIDEHTAQLGFTVGVRFAGPLDPGPDEALAHDILAVTREAMSNCARHARSSGLSSMRRRAERNGGTFQLITPANGGTHLAWTARQRAALSALP